jgi:hypothetical protein
MGPRFGASRRSGGRPSAAGGEVQPIWMEARTSSRAARCCGDVIGEVPAPIRSRGPDESRREANQLIGMLAIDLLIATIHHLLRCRRATNPAIPRQICVVMPLSPERQALGGNRQADHWKERTSAEPPIGVLRWNREHDVRSVRPAVLCQLATFATHRSTSIARSRLTATPVARSRNSRGPATVRRDFRVTFGCVWALKSHERREGHRGRLSFGR